MDEELREKKMVAIAKKSERGLGQVARKQKVEEVLFNAIRQKWAILVLVGSRLFAVQHSMLVCIVGFLWDTLLLLILFRRINCEKWSVFAGSEQRN